MTLTGSGFTATPQLFGDAAADAVALVNRPSDRHHPWRPRRAWSRWSPIQPGDAAGRSADVRVRVHYRCCGRRPARGGECDVTGNEVLVQFSMAMADSAI